MKQARILHLCSNRWNSAIAEYAVSSGRALQEYEQLMVVLADSPLERRLNEYNIPMKSVPSFSWHNFFRFSAVVTQFKPDVVLVYGGPECTFMRLLKPLFGYKLLRFFGDAERIDRFLKSRVPAGIDRVLLPAPSLVAKAADQASRYTPLRLGVDSRRYLLREDTHRSIRPQVLIFGRFDPVKGHEKAITVFATMLEQHADNFPIRPVLKIVGLPANVTTEQLREWAKARNIAEDVDIVSERMADVAQLMNQSHLGWVPSLGSELIGRVTQEFLLCGTSVLVSDAGTLPDCLFSGAGEFYPRQITDIEVIAAQLARLLLAGYNESIELRKHRHQQAKALFSLAKMKSEYSQLFNEFLS